MKQLFIDPQSKMIYKALLHDLRILSEAIPLTYSLGKGRPDVILNHVSWNALPFGPALYSRHGFHFGVTKLPEVHGLVFTVSISSLVNQISPDRPLPPTCICLSIISDYTHANVSWKEIMEQLVEDGFDSALSVDLEYLARGINKSTISEKSLEFLSESMPNQFSIISGPIPYDQLKSVDLRFFYSDLLCLALLDPSWVPEVSGVIGDEFENMFKFILPVISPFASLCNDLPGIDFSVTPIYVLPDGQPLEPDDTDTVMHGLSKSWKKVRSSSILGPRYRPIIPYHQENESDEMEIASVAVPVKPTDIN